MTSRYKKNKFRYFDIQFITATISTTMVLILLGVVVFFVFSAHNLSVHVRENLVFSMLLDDDIKEKDVVKLQDWVNAQKFVKESEYISKKQALKEHTEAMGTDPQEFLGYNPFTASIEIKLKSEYANPDSIAVIESVLKKKSNIQDVLYQKDLIQMVHENIGYISMILLGLAVLLSVISFSLIHNTIRLTIYSQRFLIHTMKLVGAKWSFIRRPFVMRNVCIGFLSGLLADLALMAGACWLVNYDLVTADVLIVVGTSVIALGMIITSLCAYVSISKFLRMKSNELYNI